MKKKIIIMLIFAFALVGCGKQGQSQPNKESNGYTVLEQKLIEYGKEIYGTDSTVDYLREDENVRTLQITLEDLENAVNNAITKNNIDTTVYNIIVTEDDVFVSTDFVAPRIASSSMAYTTTTATVNLTFSKLEETDYPVVVEYYIKKTTAPVEAYSFKKQVVLTAGTSNSYTFTDLVSATQYNANIILVDANGNKAETTLNLTTQ